MKAATDLHELVAVSEATGALLERTRIRGVIAALPALNTDEIDYRERVLTAITVTTPWESGLSRPLLAEADLTPGSPVAAAVDLTGASG